MPLTSTTQANGTAAHVAGYAGTSGRMSPEWLAGSTGWPSEADRSDHPSEPDDAATVDSRFWDEAAETLARADTVNSISPLLKSGVTGAI